MPNYVRPKQTGATVFFAVALARSGDDLLVREVGRLRDAVRVTRAERPFGIDAWVVLPDHLHAVWTLPPGDAEYSTRWRLIKARFSMGLPAGPLRPSHRARAERGIWQRRFWEHHIRTEDDLLAHIAYCHTNPVKHGLVQHPEDWPYSSLHRPRRLRACTHRQHAPLRWRRGRGACKHAPYERAQKTSRPSFCQRHALQSHTHPLPIP